MTLRNLPAIDAPAFSRALAFEPSSTVLERWNASLRPKNAQNGTVIEIYDVIGFDFWSGEGITAKTISAKLKGAGAVTVNINSPGGDFFEGLAIYNLLRAHEAKVDVQIMGLAASAASIIAMAGDSVQIGKAASLMVHNAWGLVIGNKNEMQKAAADFAGFDALMAGLYADRTGKSKADIAKLMDAETWLSGEEAVADNFADALLPADAIVEDAKAAAEMHPKAALRRVDAMLAERGLPRSERRALIKEIKSDKSGAVAPATHDAGMSDLAASLRGLSETIRS